MNKNTQEEVAVADSPEFDFLSFAGPRSIYTSGLLIIILTFLFILALKKQKNKTEFDRFFGFLFFAGVLSFLLSFIITAIDAIYFHHHIVYGNPKIIIYSLQIICLACAFSIVNIPTILSVLLCAILWNIKQNNKKIT
jgi:hypothetical protein